MCICDDLELGEARQYLEEALQAGRGVLGPLAVVAVGQQHSLRPFWRSHLASPLLMNWSKMTCTPSHVSRL